MKTKETLKHVQGNIETENKLPEIKIDTDSIINLSQLESPYKKEIIEWLNNQVIGQQKAKEEIADFVSKALVKVWHTKGTLGNLFFHWPTWVWKTEIVRALSKHLFWVENWFIKIDCAEFAESHTKSRFFGSPPSYIWYWDPTIFDSKIFYNAYDIAKKTWKLNPILKKLGAFNIVLFDEIEKAHSEVIQSLLNILDEWKLQLADTKKAPINFWNTLVIFTSNIWEKELSELKAWHSMWFFKDKKEKDKDKDRKKVFEESLKSKFSPEFIWRIDSLL